MPIVNTAANATPSVELLWIPLGSGQRVVKFSGKLFEAISALFQRRATCDIYHAAPRSPFLRADIRSRRRLSRTGMANSEG